MDKKPDWNVFLNISDDFFYMKMKIQRGYLFNKIKGVKYRNYYYCRSEYKPLLGLLTPFVV